MNEARAKSDSRTHDEARPAQLAGSSSAEASSSLHRYHAAPDLQRQLERSRFSGNWSAPKGIAEDNDKILGGGGFLLGDGQSVEVPAVAAELVNGLPNEDSAATTSTSLFPATSFCVANVDTLTAALVLGDACALNHANAATPGGRYRHGGRAQEEDLCRCLPQLWPSLESAAISGWYPLHPSSVLVSRSLLAVRRVGTYERCASLGTVTILTAAMPCGVADRRPAGGWANSPWAVDVRPRIRAVLHAARSTGRPNLVLGAFGCGAFGNPAGPVAAIFRDLLRSDEFRGAFKRVVFAVLDPLGTGNIGPFRKELASLADA